METGKILLRHQLLVLVLIKSVCMQERFVLDTTGSINEVTPISTPLPPPPVNTTIETKIPLQALVCPPNVKIPIFSLPCGRNEDCKVFGRGLVCCKENCVLGVIHSVQKIANTPEIIKDNLVSTNAISKTKFVCPNKEARTPFLSLPCQRNADCKVFGSGLLCCHKICLKAVAPKVVDVSVQTPKTTEVAIQALEAVHTQKITVVENTQPIIKADMKLTCPDKETRIFFNFPCIQTANCKAFGADFLCCGQRCLKGTLVKQQVENAEKITQSVRQKQSISDAPPKQQLAVVEVTKMVCPSKDVRVPFLSLRCNRDSDCKVFGGNLLCCRQRCLNAIPAPKPELNHTPTLFGLVDRSCPAIPIAEILDIKECKSDSDCNPRICCQEKLAGQFNKSYCRTPMHQIEKLPGAKQIQEPLRNFISYMQCTQPPPLDLFPKPCMSTLDCFPNLCCQENGKKFCRPPKRSLLSAVVGVATRIGASEATKKFIERISK